MSARPCLAASGLFLVFGVVACGPAPAPPPPPAPTATVSAPPAPPPPTATAVTEAPPAECKEPEGPRPEVVNLAAKDVAAQDWIGWKGDSGAPVEAACKKLEKRRANMLKKLKGNEHHVEHIGRCFPSAKGAWVLDTSGDVQPLKADADHPEKGWEVRFSLAYVTPEGKLLRSKKSTHSVWVRGNEAQDFRVIGLFDYDGDGVSELALLGDHHYGDEDRTETRTMHTWKDGDAVPYPHAGFAFLGLHDVDGDGRPDLRVPGAFSAERLCGMEGGIYRGPAQIARSLADGRFSADDDVAKEVVRAQCGPAPKELVVKQGDAPAVDGDATVTRIACGLVYGASADDLTHRIRSEYPLPHEPDDSEPADQVAGACVSLKELVKLAGQKPPFVIDAPCPPK